MTPPKPTRILANTRELVEILSVHGAMTPAAIAEEMSMPRASVYRLVDGLNAIDLTRTLPDSRVALSLRWLLLADASRSGMSEWRGAGSFLADLVEVTGQTAFLTLLRGNQAVCIDWAQGRGIGVLILKPGRSLPLHTGAAGRVLLAFAADAEDYLKGAPFAALTPSTLVTEADLRADIATTRQQGYTVSDEDATLGIAALGMPVLGERREAVACVSIGGLREDIRTHQAQFLAALRRTVGGLRKATGR